MAIDTSISRSRRALLAGGLGGLAALVASALGRPLPASATDGDVIHVGDELSGTSVTRISNLGGTAPVLYGESSKGIGVLGSSDSSSGVRGESATNVGVHGYSTSGFGVYGTAMSAGIHGYSRLQIRDRPA